MNQYVKYLLVGGGIASGQAARAIREIDRQGEILLVSQEINRPYNRPPLSKGFLLGKQDRQSLFCHSAEWFNENHVQLRTGRRVSHLDTTRHCATLDNGEEISFDRLLIATGGGAAPLQIPGAALPNLIYLRTLEDADRLLLAIEKARQLGRKNAAGQPEAQAVIIGAGTLGVELAGSLAQLGLRVHLAVSGGHPMKQFIGEPAGRCLTRFLEQHGIQVHLNGRAARLEGDGRVQRVMLASGESIPCGFAIAAVGMQTNKDLLRGTPIAAERAVLVDPRCETSVPHIYAAGDCTAVLDPLFGKHRQLEHWDSAEITGRIAGSNMAGGSAQYDVVSSFKSQIFDLPIVQWGAAKWVDRRIFRGTAGADSPSFVEIGIAADDRIAQVVAFGATGEDHQLQELVRQRLRVDGNQESLKDPGVPLNRILNG